MATVDFEKTCGFYTAEQWRFGLFFTAAFIAAQSWLMGQPINIELAGSGESLFRFDGNVVSGLPEYVEAVFSATKVLRGDLEPLILKWLKEDELYDAPMRVPDGAS
ncbi:MAG: hypothetical protein WCY67_09010 [Acidithiobacillus sp.]